MRTEKIFISSELFEEIERNMKDETYGNIKSHKKLYIIYKIDFWKNCRGELN